MELENERDKLRKEIKFSDKFNNVNSELMRIRLQNKEHARNVSPSLQKSRTESLISMEGEGGTKRNFAFNTGDTVGGRSSTREAAEEDLIPATLVNKENQVVLA